jgi:threonyl-tRNA synthetase
MRKSGIRVNLRDDNLTVSKRIREAEISRSSYIIVVGDKEIADKTVTIRHYKKGDVGTQPLKDFIKSLQKEIADRE